jgi:hypothetical protein
MRRFEVGLSGFYIPGQDYTYSTRFSSIPIIYTRVTGQSSLLSFPPFPLSSSNTYHLPDAPPPNLTRKILSLSAFFKPKFSDLEIFLLVIFYIPRARRVKYYSPTASASHPSPSPVKNATLASWKID